MMRMLEFMLSKMEIVQVPNETIKFKYGIVDKYVVMFQDKVVYVGSKPQCHRFKFYMHDASPQEILDRVKLIK